MSDPSDALNLEDPDVVAGLARMAHAKLAAGRLLTGRAERYAVTVHPLTPSLWPNGDPYGPPVQDPRGEPRDVSPGPVPPNPTGGGEPSGFAAGVEGSERAARRWTDSEKAEVDAAIAQTAQDAAEFTTDDVWRTLGDAFPVTKGMTSRLVAAARGGIIRNTGRIVRSTRGGAHDHAQRLTVWASLHHPDHHPEGTTAA